LSVTYYLNDPLSLLQFSQILFLFIGDERCKEECINLKKVLFSYCLKNGVQLSLTFCSARTDDKKMQRVQFIDKKQFWSRLLGFEVYLS